MSALDEFYDEIVELKATLAALQARRCDTCAHHSIGEAGGNRFCGLLLTCRIKPDFYCQAWESTEGIDPHAGNRGH